MVAAGGPVVRVSRADVEGMVRVASMRPDPWLFRLPTPRRRRALATFDDSVVACVRRAPDSPAPYLMAELRDRLSTRRLETIVAQH